MIPDEQQDEEKERLKAMREEISAQRIENPEIRYVAMQLARIVSHLESERGTFVRAMKKIEKHDRILVGDENQPGLNFQMRQIIEDGKARRKLSWSIMATVAAVLLIKLGELLFKHGP